MTEQVYVKKCNGDFALLHECGTVEMENEFFWRLRLSILNYKFQRDELFDQQFECLGDL